MSTDTGRLQREAIVRRKQYAEESVAHALVPEYEADGWSQALSRARITRMRKPFNHDELLENKVWYLMFLLGYPEISSGRNFKVRIARKGAEPIQKQIDVLARDDETVIVAECKSSVNITRRTLQKDIEEFANLKKPIAQAVTKHYGATFKPKIIWLFVTSNIIWSDNDRQRASGANIHVVTEKELRYYLQIADHLKSAARFQFLAEFLKGQKIPGLENVKVPAVKGKLGGKTYYSFVSTPRQMLKIAFVNHRALNDPTGAPSYQRLVSRTRLQQIGNFIRAGGFFPTNILVNLISRARFEQVARDAQTSVTFGHLYLPAQYRSAWVIDGQHRLYGYAPLHSKFLDQNIMVVAFEELKKEEEANLFVTINHEQKSVPKTLLDDLEGELKWGSDKPPERIGSIGARLIGLLNEDIGEPLYGRVTRQGIPPTEKTCLTVPALKDGLRRSKLIGESILSHKEFSPGPLSGTTDLDTLDRARAAINSYLGLVSSANQHQWSLGRQGYLCTNVALQAYLRLFGSVIDYMEDNKGMSARELDPNELVSEVEEYLDPILKWLSTASAQQMERHFKVPHGSGGPPEYYFRLCAMIHQQFSDFTSEDFESWLQGRSEEKVSEADRKLKELGVAVQKTIFSILKRRYSGEGATAYWDNGVPDKNMKIRAYEKSLDHEAGERMPLENYLDFIDYKKIVEHKENWLLFKPIFDIPEPGEKGYAKNVKWMDRLNELRRIPAHPTENRSYKPSDFQYIDFVHERFLENVEKENAEPTTD